MPAQKFFEIRPRLEDQKSLRALGMWQKGLRNFTDFWPEFAKTFLGEIQENFRTRGGKVGGWKPLSPRYAAAKSAQYPGRGILQRTFRLQRSLLPTGSRVGGGVVGPEGVYEPSKTVLRIGTAVPYADRHDRGLDGMPKRQILFYNDNAGYDDLWSNWLKERAKVAGLEVQ